MSERPLLVRWGRRLLAVAVALLLLALLVVPVFVAPAREDPAELRAAGPADAVVVLGGDPSRLATAEEAVIALPGPAPAVLLSVPYPAPVLDCGALPSRPATPLACFVPAPFTTSGEAAHLVARAAAEGWSRVVVVTSEFHLTRARVLVSRCVDVLAPGLDVDWFAAPHDATSLHGAWAIATEIPSLLATPWDHQPACVPPIDG